MKRFFQRTKNFEFQIWKFYEILTSETFLRENDVWPTSTFCLPSQYKMENVEIGKKMEFQKFWKKSNYHI